MHLHRMSQSKSGAQMRKGVLELCVLRVLRNEEAYASDITKALKAADLLVVGGTLYPLLSRLKNAGFLNYRWEESASGPPRKYYSLTIAGKSSLKSLDSEWDQFVQSVNSVVSSVETSHTME
jgi:PadR family transcriptional regulator, regulatory protein PadR